MNSPNTSIGHVAGLKLALASTAIFAALLAAGCDNAGEGALSGAGLGAASGAILGSLSGNAGTGAAIGAVAGGLGGAVIGDQNQRHAQQVPAPAYASAPAQAPQSEVIVAQPSAPPAPRQQVVLVPPAPQYVWIPGEYEWVGGGWVWCAGRWERPYYGHYWEPGRWHHGPHGQVWVRGHWR